MADGFSGDERRGRTFRVRKDIGPAEIVMILGLLGWGGDRLANGPGAVSVNSQAVTADIAAIKQTQAAQVETNRRIESNIERVSHEVRQQGEVLRGIEAKVNRARL